MTTPFVQSATRPSTRAPATSNASPGSGSGSGSGSSYGPPISSSTSTSPTPVIPSLSSAIADRIAQNKPFYSFEFFPPKTAEGVSNLYKRMERMHFLEPLWMDVVMGTDATLVPDPTNGTSNITTQSSTSSTRGGTPSLVTSMERTITTTTSTTHSHSHHSNTHIIPSTMLPSSVLITLDICTVVASLCRTQIMIHLSCTNLDRIQMIYVLERIRICGIHNILVLRGDPPRGHTEWMSPSNGFQHAYELVRFIRELYGDYFTIAVAGFPEGHIESINIHDDIKHLRAKVDAGANFIITQAFFDVDIFLEWVTRCRAAGIAVPIIPGILPIQNYAGFRNITGYCRTTVPKHVSDALEPIKHDDMLVKQYGIELASAMCRKLLESGAVPGIHYYTLNLERSVTKILETLGYITSVQAGRMPWLQSPLVRRQKEDVRPIFWSNRPQSYLERTKLWDADDFPNGRWGDITSPAFGELSDYHLSGAHRIGSRASRLRMWGTPSVPADIFHVFVRFIRGEIRQLPWCDYGLQLETEAMKEQLVTINQYGFLTINSQPRVNGASSTDPAVGWGGPHGYVYQKAYLEFFTSETHLHKIVAASKQFPSISYQAVNREGRFVSNVDFTEGSRTNAVTWGVFPNTEIIQPTVVDCDAFLIWQDEAFSLWLSSWQSLYEPDSISHTLISEIHDTYYLVNVVDNNYVDGTLFQLFQHIIK